MIFKSKQVNLDPEPCLLDEPETDCDGSCREQFDTPVNRVLADFRAIYADDPERADYARRWVLDLDDGDEWSAAAPAEIDHARKVLTRLANWRDE